jgi:broad specificity phosphatase PhoE
MELTLIRHAPTQYSSAGLFMGDLDVPATPQGLALARELGKRLDNVCFTRIVCSPLSRAFESAKMIFPGREIIKCNALSERALGAWAGCSKAELRISSPQAFLSSGFMDPAFTPPNGESLGNLLTRIRSFVSQVESGSDSEHIAAVTHNGVMRTMRCILEQRPYSELFAESEPYLLPKTFLYKARTWSRISLIQLDNLVDGQTP